MLSGTLSTSCMTTPLSSRRFCSLFKSEANTETGAKVIHAAPIKERFILTSTVGTSLSKCFTALCCALEIRSARFASGEGDALPDSQAGHFHKLMLGILSGPGDHQDDSPDQRQSTEEWRYGDVLMLFRGGVDRATIQPSFLMGVIEPLIGQRQAAKNNQ